MAVALEASSSVHPLPKYRNTPNNSKLSGEELFPIQSVETHLLKKHDLLTHYKVK